MARPKKPDSEKAKYQLVAINKSDYKLLNEKIDEMNKLGFSKKKIKRIDVFHHMIFNLEPAEVVKVNVRTS